MLTLPFHDSDLYLLKSMKLGTVGYSKSRGTISSSAGQENQNSKTFKDLSRIIHCCCRLRWPSKWQLVNVIAKLSHAVRTEIPVKLMSKD